MRSYPVGVTGLHSLEAAIQTIITRLYAGFSFPDKLPPASSRSRVVTVSLTSSGSLAYPAEVTTSATNGWVYGWEVSHDSGVRFHQSQRERRQVHFRHQYRLWHGTTFTASRSIQLPGAADRHRLASARRWLPLAGRTTARTIASTPS